MRKIILFSSLVIFALAPFKAQSSHLMAGQITATQINGLTYEVTATVYRDVLGIPMSTLERINYDGDSASAPWSAATNIPSVPVPFITGTEEYTFVDTITFPETGVYNISYSSCCRNYAILNLTTNGFALQTTVTIDTISGNSTPVFFNAPVTFAPVNTLWQYTPLAYDADGDSLAWRLDTPLASGNYHAPFSDTSQPFAVNPQNGEILWMPNTLGNFVVSILIDEYRGGMLIGTIRRDMQIIVIMSIGSKPVFNTSGWPVNNIGSFQFDLAAGSPFNLGVSISDPDNDYLKLKEITAPVNIGKGNPPLFTSTLNSFGLATGTITWAPSSSQVRNQPYSLILECNEHTPNIIFKNYLPVYLKVNTVTATTEMNPPMAGSIYPSIVSDQIYIPLSLKKPSQVKIQILNAAGQLACSPYLFDVGANAQILVLNRLNLADGFYFLKIDDGVRIETQKFVVRKK